MPPYHPALMLKVLLYGYATGVRSSRRIEERLRSDVGFMFLAGRARPDHKTIGEFRRRHLAAFAALFLEILVLCQKAGLVKLGRVALDGTKIKANASRHKAMSYGRMPEREAALEAEAQARAGNPDAVPDQRAQRNFTDPESRMMRSRPDGWVQGYNVGAVVDEAAQVIVATLVTADPTDTRSLPALVAQVRATTGRSPRRLLADAAYGSEDNLAALATAGIDAYVALARDHHGRAAPAAPRGRIPARLSVRGRMARKLRTKRGRAHYARRKAIVEPVFGQIEEARGFRRFSLRGLAAVQAEWMLVVAVHNLGKLFTSGRATG